MDLNIIEQYNNGRRCFENADLSGANLSGADLSGADLREADLSWADLSGAIGNGRELRSLQVMRWKIAYTSEVLAIGCHQTSIEEWLTYELSDILAIDNDASKLWQTWRPVLIQVIETSFPGSTAASKPADSLVPSAK